MAFFVSSGDKRKRQDWTQDQLNLGVYLKLVEKKTYKKAATASGMPLSTLKDYVGRLKDVSTETTLFKGIPVPKAVRLGARTALLPRTEAQLAEWLLEMSRLSMSVNFKMLQLMALKLSGRNPLGNTVGNWNADSVQVPDSDDSDSEADADDLAAVFHQVELFGKSWRRRFFSRFPALQTVWAKSVDYDRLESSEPKRITHFFEVFNEILAKIESPSQLWNCDETSVAPGTTEGRMRVV